MSNNNDPTVITIEDDNENLIMIDDEEGGGEPMELVSDDPELCEADDTIGDVVHVSDVSKPELPERTVILPKALNIFNFK